MSAKKIQNQQYTAAEVAEMDGSCIISPFCSVAAADNRNFKYGWYESGEDSLALSISRHYRKIVIQDFPE